MHTTLTPNRCPEEDGHSGTGTRRKGVTMFRHLKRCLPFALTTAIVLASGGALFAQAKTGSTGSSGYNPSSSSSGGSNSFGLNSGSSGSNGSSSNSFGLNPNSIGFGTTNTNSSSSNGYGSTSLI